MHIVNIVLIVKIGYLTFIPAFGIPVFIPESSGIILV